ncbi:hypothetical protein Droror1_Dr00023844 [Drosera rotundifolia]
MLTPPNKVIHEITHGLSQIDVSFIWVLRDDIVSDEPQPLPFGFEVASPRKRIGDQFTNRKLVVDDWKVGLNLCDGESVQSDEVVKKIEGLIGGELGERPRVRLKEVKGVLDGAWSSGGSSERQFTKFVEDVKVKIDQRCK